jgi:type VI secretion system protein VasG
MTMVPYLPISMKALGNIARLKLDQLLTRLKNNQRIDATYSDKLVEYIASRCTEVDTGARNIDHILRASLLPMLSNAILERMAEGNPPKKLAIDIDDQKNFTAAFSS